MFDKLGNMGNMLEKANEMKKEVNKVKEELKQKEISSSYQDLIEVIMTGDFKVKKINIAPELLKEAENEKIEELVTAAVNKAIDEVQKVSQERMKGITGGLNIPGVTD